LEDSIGIDVIPYVSCFSYSFDDEDPELPVVASLKDDVCADSVG
jgi:hypothetical protein